MMAPSRSRALVSRVLDLHPAQARARPVAGGDALRDDAFEAERAAVAEHRLAVGACHVLREAQRRAGCLERLRQHPAATDQFADPGLRAR